MIETTRVRTVLSMHSKPVLKRHVRLQYDKVRDSVGALVARAGVLAQ